MVRGVPDALFRGETVFNPKGGNIDFLIIPFK